MAIDKAIDSTKLNQSLTAEANAIRAKTGGVAAIAFDYAGGNGFANAIAAIPEKVDKSWHQCPQAARDYLANVDYTGVPYTQSSIGTYAPATPVAANSKPIGLSIDGEIFYNAVPGVKTPFATTNKAGTIKPMDQVRWIRVDGDVVKNMRDIGGWPCDGGTTKYGLIYRSGNPGTTAEDLIVNQLGIKTEIDLTADGIPYTDKMRYVSHTSYAMYSLSNTAAWTAFLRGIFDSVNYGIPVLIHCSMGADRTGTLVCILQGLLGVSQSHIDMEYELTSFFTIRARNGNYQGGTSDWAHLIGEINALYGNSFRDKCVNFVLSLGFTIAEINAFRSAMIDGSPATLTAPTATVTGTYTGCGTSNQAATADLYGAYSATITPSNGYTLSGATVSVRMGGVDVTSSVYSNGVINISNVTGNVVISVAAAVDDQRVELFDPATATLNVRFNGSGGTQAKDGNFATDFIPVSGLNTSAPWRIHIREIGNDEAFRGAPSNASVIYLKSDKTVMNTNYGRLTINTSTTGTNTLCMHNDSAGGIYLDINKTGDGNQIPSNFFNLADVAYIRLCLTYGSTAIASAAALANVSIKADEITA